MRKLQSNVFVIILLALTVNISFAQKINSKKADIQFEMKAYELAIDSYQQYLSVNPDDILAMGRLAESYERTNDLISSARWYEKIVSYPDHGSYYNIQYGKLLMKLGLYDRAKLEFGKLKSINPGFADQYMKSCDFAKNVLSLGDRFIISQLKVSGTEDDFGPAFFNDKLVFNSFRKNEGERNESLIQRELSDLYRSDVNASIAFSMSGVLNSYKGIGPVRYSKDGKKVVFTRNSFYNSVKHVSGDEKDMSIYIADVDNAGNFVNEIPLPVNGAEYSSAFACFGQNESEIYFSSNKNSDNFDIFMISLVNGVWTEPVSPGKNINTPGNEITPYFSGSTLYFSSDYLNGIGGYDVFKASVYNDEWSFPVNLGKGVNSPGDDLYYVKNEYGNKAYFASSRLGTKGGMDLFSASPSSKKKTEEVAYNNVPEAVDLASLQEKQGVRIANQEVKTVAESEASFVTVAALEGAKMVAYDEVIFTPANVYFIQLASVSKSRINSAQFKNLTKFGNVYKVQKGDLYKIRLGYFVSESEATSVLASVRQQGFRDAFVVEDFLNTREMELLESSYNFTNTQKYEKPANVGNYKIKLAAYTNPLYFDMNKVKDLGVIEQWSKGKWTIFILSGYTGFDDASESLLKVKNRGFASAEIVMDQDGVLTTIKND
ncbi:MAG: SPOR domain-containing protein [Deltaproteobacteria bacterium]